ncbi:MAG: flagellar protein FliO/FliZ [Actinomycetota bacterium]|jgi:flagellar protein FliO/FliZ|nr:flagellar protein FliO/FliZ [Actinomycetota bacterium]
MSEGSLAGTLVRLAVSLTVVLTLMILLARYLRHRQNGSGLAIGMAPRRRRTPYPLQVLTRQGLSRGSSVAVVSVSGQLLLLGVTESTVSLLRELDDLDEPELDTQDTAAPPAVLRLGDVREQVVSAVENLRQRTVRRG